MKVVLTAELELPDDWEIVKRQDGMRVFKLGDKFIDLDFLCLSTTDSSEDAEWVLDETLEQEFFEYVKGSELQIDES